MSSIAPRARGRHGSRRLAPAALIPLVAALAGLAACGGGGGGPATAPDGSAWVDPNTYSANALSALTTPNEHTAVSHGSVTVGGTAVAYTATAGHLSVPDAGGAPEASMFYVAYTADGAAPAGRPVTFFFNGGPGSSTAWLHLGSWAPRRLVTGVPATTQAAPFPYVDNPDSLIDTSDLVFVDAVGTGLSEAISPHRNEDFWSVDADGAVFRDFVTRWLAANGRTASPLFIYGESYGTVRAPLLTRLLETAGTPVAGLVIQSSILDYNSNCSITSRQTAGCGGFLPSYAAVGEYWNLVTPAGPDTAGFLDQVRSYADTVYEPLADQWLDEGSPSTPPAGADLATLQADTGLAQSWWSTHFDMDFDTYRHHLLADTVLGVYDGRMSARPGTPLAADDDPSNTFIYAPFQQAMGSVLAQLGFTTPATYVLESNAIASWDFSHAGRALPDVVPDLQAALALEPTLKVLSIGGEHDLITPFHQTELDLARLDAGAPVTSHFYAGGHMVYLNDPSRAALKADLAAFYASAQGAR